MASIDRLAEARIVPDAIATRLAVFLIDQMNRGGADVQVAVIQQMHVDAEEGVDFTIDQIVAGLARIGCLYVEAVKKVLESE